MEPEHHPLHRRPDRKRPQYHLYRRAFPDNPMLRNNSLYLDEEIPRPEPNTNPMTQTVIIRRSEAYTEAWSFRSGTTDLMTTSERLEDEDPDHPTLANPNREVEAWDDRPENEAATFDSEWAGAQRFARPGRMLEA